MLKDAIFGSSHPPLSETNQCVNGLIGEIISVNHAASHHLPYAEMICKAIEELNEEGGSNDASISSYIKLEYKELPWAHETLLSHHLGRLCSRGQIVMTSSDGCYKLPTSKTKKNVDQLPQKEEERAATEDKERGFAAQISPFAIFGFCDHYLGLVLQIIFSP
ncbi:hypothetical protein Patl1_19674 [Pistacia atlantica]|uniref:Uncharacterized protein n=1 Tax=Pistacia atlantica TaxID=434234 RepID=A0ACC1C226_9ROSI|nr:hypothetical protein Patl1_19674 [Pistacia atlantica]